MAISEYRPGVGRTAPVCHLESKGAIPIKSLADAIPAGAEIIIPGTTRDAQERDVKIHDPQKLIPVDNARVLWRMPTRASRAA